MGYDIYSGEEVKVCDVMLTKTSDLKNFVDASQKMDGVDIFLKSGRFLVDAKSIMGVFSLDLTKPTEVYIDGASEEEIDKFVGEIDDYIVQET